SLAGCSSEALEKSDEPKPVHYLGDGTLGSVSLTAVFTAQAKVKLSATAVAFNPTVKNELWVTLRQFPSNKPCTSTSMTGCDALHGLMGVVDDATGDAPSPALKEDGYSWHFMRLRTAIAWGDGQLFATCGEGYTDNFEDDPTPYAGPVLWSSDPKIFGV